MELEKRLFEKYNAGILKWLSRLDFMDFLVLRNLKLLKSKDEKEILKHIEMLEQMQDICRIFEFKGFLFALSLQLRRHFNIGANIDRESFLRSFKETLVKEDLEEYIQGLDGII